MRALHPVLLGALALIACDSTTPEPTPASVTVTLAAVTLDPGDSTQATVTASDASGNPVSAASPSFTTSNGSVATVSPSGRVRAMSDGSASVVASVRGVSGSAPLTVYTSVATVGVASTRTTIEADDTTRLTVTLASAKGATISGRTVTYTSSNASVATVSAAGLVQGVSAGTADITASVEGKSGAITVTIQPRTFALRASQDSVRLLSQAQVDLTADALDAGGNVIAGRTVTWTSLDPLRAAVSATGATTAQVTWQGPGPTRIVASVGAARDTVKISAAGDLVVTTGVFTQGVQDAEGTIPMITGRLPAVLHVLMSSAALTRASSKVVLRLTDPQGALVFADTEDVVNPIGSTPSLASPAARFMVPAVQLVAGRKWEVIRDVAGETPDDDATNDRYPRAGPATMAIVNVPALNVRFVPIVLNSHGGASPTLTTADLPGYLRTALSSLPLAQINATIGTPFSTNGNFGTPPSGGNASAFWSPLLQELDAARMASPDPSIHWFGVVSPPSGFNFVQTGGMAYVRSDYATNTAEHTRTALGVRTGWFSNQTQARDLVAHELSHNFGRLHTPCGSPSSLDADYPYPDGRIGVPMHDVHALATGISTTLPDVSALTGDIMGYCFPGWASAYVYAKILTARTTSTAVVSGQPRVREEVLIVQGSVAVDGTPSLIAPVSLAGFPSDIAAHGEYRVQGLGDSGEILFERPVDPASVDHSDERHFTIALSMDPTVRTTRRLRVTGRGRASELLLATTRTPPDARLEASGLAASCGDVSTRVAVQDATTGEVLGIGRGSLRVRARRGALLDVRCAGPQSRRAQLRVP